MNEFIKLNKDIVRVSDITNVTYPKLERLFVDKLYVVIYFKVNNLDTRGVRYFIEDAVYHTVVKRKFGIRYKTKVLRTRTSDYWKGTDAGEKALKHYNEICEALNVPPSD